MKNFRADLKERISQLSERFKLDSDMFNSLCLTNLISGELRATDIQCMTALKENLSQIKVLLGLYNQHFDDPEMKVLEEESNSYYEQVREQVETYFERLTRIVNIKS